MPRSLHLLALVIFAALHASCAAVTFDSQEARFDRDFEADSLTLELEYHDVAAIDAKRRTFLAWGVKDGPDLKAASSFLQGVAHGERIFILANPFFAWDLEELAHEPGLTDAERAYMAKVHVAEARIEVGEADEINVYQRIVFPDVSKALALLNAGLRRELLAAFAAGEFASEQEDEMQAASLAVALADAQAGRDWVAWGEEGLSLKVPMTSKLVLAYLQEIANIDHVKALRKRLPLDEEDLGELEKVQSGARLLLGAASDVRIEADHLVLVFGDKNADLALHFGPEYSADLEDFRPALREHLQESGFEFPVVYTAK